MTQKLEEKIKAGFFAEVGGETMPKNKIKPTKQQVEWLADFMYANWEALDKRTPNGSVLYHIVLHKFGPTVKNVSGRVLHRALRTYLSTGLFSGDYVQK